MLIGHLFDQAADFLFFGFCVAHVAELTAMGPEPTPQVTLFLGKVFIRRCLLHTELLQCGSGRFLGQDAGLFHRFFQFVA